jgi:hypothetical protein
VGLGKLGGNNCLHERELRLKQRRPMDALKLAALSAAEVVARPLCCRGAGGVVDTRGRGTRPNKIVQDRESGGDEINPTISRRTSHRIWLLLLLCTLAAEIDTASILTFPLAVNTKLVISPAGLWHRDDYRL